MTDIDWDRVKGELSYIARGDHMGDVNNGLMDLIPALGLGKPEWDENLERMRMPWEIKCEKCGYIIDPKYGCECD